MPVEQLARRPAQVLAAAAARPLARRRFGDGVLLLLLLLLPLLPLLLLLQADLLLSARASVQPPQLLAARLWNPG